MSLLNKIKILILIVLFIFVCSFYQNSIAQINVSGDVSGIWQSDQNPYYVSGDITVPNDSILIIDAGVDVFFVGTYTFTIDGLLKANGLTENMIVFHGGGAPGAWKKIYFSENASAGCVLEHCIIKDGGFDDLGTISIFNNDTNITISNCEIHNGASSGIYVRSYIWTEGGDSITKKCNPIIANNYIHHHHDNGVYISAYCNNILANTGSSANNISIASPVIKNNIIYANDSSGIKCYSFANGHWYAGDYKITVKANPVIQQNTIYGNSASGIHCIMTIESGFCYSVFEVNPIITSNIISNNSGYGLNARNEVNVDDRLRNSFNEVSVENVKNNCFWENDSSNFKSIGSGLGDINQVNVNGDSCDRTYNIFFSPKFCNDLKYDFHLKSTSKCIDAGDLSLPYDDDDSFPDIGAFPYDSSWVTFVNYKNQFKVPNEYFLHQNYPNPFNPETTIRFDLPESQYVIFKVYNIFGQEISILTNRAYNAGSHKVIWDGKDVNGKDVSSGIYIYKIQAGEFVKGKKMSLLR